MHGFYGQYNAGGMKLPLNLFKDMRESRYDGYMTGAGVSYGYQWHLTGKLSLEAQLGIGYAYLNYDRYECQSCGELIESAAKHTFSPTGLGVSLIYFFR